MDQNSRREFFKKIIGLTGAALLAPVLFSSAARAEEKRRGAAPAAGAGEALAEPGKDIAGALGYVHKSVVAGKTCSGCTLFVAAGKKGADEVGKCGVMPGKLVKAGGYCNSWAKKA